MHPRVSGEGRSGEGAPMGSPESPAAKGPCSRQLKSRLVAATPWAACGCSGPGPPRCRPLPSPGPRWPVKMSEKAQLAPLQRGVSSDPRMQKEQSGERVLTARLCTALLLGVSPWRLLGVCSVRADPQSFCLSAAFLVSLGSWHRRAL